MRNSLSDLDRKNHDIFKKDMADLKRIIFAFEVSGKLQPSKALRQLKKEVNYPVEWVTTSLSQVTRLQLIHDLFVRNKELHCIWHAFLSPKCTSKEYRDLLDFLACELVRMEKNDGRFQRKGMESEKLGMLRELILLALTSSLPLSQLCEKTALIMRMKRGSFFGPQSKNNMHQFFASQKTEQPLLSVPQQPLLEDPSL